MTIKEILEIPEAQRIFDALSDESTSAMLDLVRTARKQECGLPEIRYKAGFLDGLKVAEECLRRLRKG